MAQLQVTVLLFAAARERAGRPRLTLSLPEGATVRDALSAVAGLHPELGSLLPYLRVAVDQDFAPPEHPLREGAEVALIPPVAGGRGVFRLTTEPLSLDEVVRAVSGVSRGAVVTFTGAVRAETRGRAVVRLEYEAYGPMAERKLADIGAEVEAKWPGACLAIVHRTGVLLPGELAVVIAAGAPHRADAFAACRHGIERLKEDVPIWKREVYADGATWVGLGP